MSVLTFRDDPWWWLIRRSGFHRWWYRKLITEVLYDLELSDSGLGSQKDKWMGRLKRLEDTGRRGNG